MDITTRKYIVLLDNMKGMMYAYGPYSFIEATRLAKKVKRTPGVFKNVVELRDDIHALVREERS